MRRLLTILTILTAGCVNTQTQKTQIDRELGRHYLPFQPNKRFILQSVVPDPGAWTFGPITIAYLLDGKRRQLRLVCKGTTDGYVTDMGRILASEIEGVESPIMDERVIQLVSGEEITIAGNTIDKGGISLLTIKQAEQVGAHQPATR